MKQSNEAVQWSQLIQLNVARRASLEALLQSTIGQSGESDPKVHLARNSVCILMKRGDLLKIFHPLDHREWTFSSSSKIMVELELFSGNLLLALQAWDSSSELDSWWIRKIPEFLQLALWLTACDWTRSMHLRSLGSYKLLPFSNSFKCFQILPNTSNLFIST